MRGLAALVALQMALWSPATVLALPSGPSVQNGDVRIRSFGNRMWIRQTSNSAIVNYNSFSIAGNEQVRFIQPSSSAAILNRVTGGSRSVIEGALKANGSVYLINPNGILFTSSARVNVGSLVASGLNMSNSDFLSRRLNFSGGGGSVVNNGSLSAGKVVLVGGTVENNGGIGGGRVILAAGKESVLIDSALDGQIRIVIDGQEDPLGAPVVFGADPGQDEAPQSSVDPVEPTSVDPTAADQAQAEVAATQEDGPFGVIFNRGLIISEDETDGGHVTLYGQRVGQLGEIHADASPTAPAGQIEIYGDEFVLIGADSVTSANGGTTGDGGSVRIIGRDSLIVETGSRVESKGGSESGNGGFVEFSGYDFIQLGTPPNTTAANGRNGMFLLDPGNFFIDDRDDVDKGFFDGDVTFKKDDNLTPPAIVPKENDARMNIGRLEDLLRENSVMAISTQAGGGNQSGQIALQSDLNFDNLSGGNGYATDTGVLLLDASGNLFIQQPIRDADTSDNDRLDVILFADNQIQIGVDGGTPNAGRVDSGGGDIIIKAGGGIFLNGNNGSPVLDAGSGGNITMASTGANITIDDLITAGGSIAIQANTTLDINSSITGSRNITLASETGSIFQDANVSGQRDIVLYAPNGSVNMAGNVQTTTASGRRIVVDAGGGNADISGLSAPNGDIIVVGNSITDAGSTFTDVTGGRAMLYALSGSVGSANRIETDVQRLEGYAASGSFRISEANDLILGGPTGPIQIRAANAQGAYPDAPVDVIVAITNIGSVVAAGSGNIDITTVNGDITVAGPVAQAGTGDILLDANGAGTDVTIDQVVAANVGDVVITAPDRILQNAPVVSTNSGDVLVSTATGDIIFSDDAIALAQNGDIRYFAGDDLTVATVVGDGGNISLLANGFVQVNSNVVNLGSGDIDIESFSDTFTMADPALIASDGGDVRIAASGNARIAGVVATQGTVRIQSANGSILDNGDNLPADIIATAASLSAPNGSVGTSADGLETVVGTIAAEAGSGGINVANAGNVTIGTVGPLSVNRVQPNGSSVGVPVPSLSGFTTTSGGDIVGIAIGDLTVASPVMAGGAGNILLATKTGEVQGVTQTAGVVLNNTVTSGSGHITIVAGDTLTQNAAGDVTTTGGDVTEIATGGDIAMANGAETRSGGGNILFRAASNVVVGSINAGSGDAAVVAGNGSILDGGNTHRDIIAQNAQLIATGGSVGTDLNGLETELDTVAALAIGGGVKINEQDGSLTIGTVGPVNVNVVGTDGSVSSTNAPLLSGLIVSNGNVLVSTADGFITVADPLLNAGTGNVRLDANGGAGDDVTVNNLLFAQDGNISLLAADSVLQNSNVVNLGTGDLDFEAPNGVITMADGTVAVTEGGNVRFAADGDVTLGTVVATNPASGSVRFQSANGSILDAGEALPADVIANRAQFSAVNGGVGTLGSGVDDAIEIITPLVAAEADAEGINLASIGDVTIGAVPAITVQQVTSVGGTTPVTGPALAGHTTSSGGSIVHVGSGAMTVDEPVSADTTGDILLANLTNPVNNVTLNAPVSSGSGNISVVAGAGLYQAAAGDITTGGGDIAALSKNGPIQMADGAVASSSGGNIVYVGDTNIIVGSLNAATGLVAAVALHGRIFDGGDTDMDVVAHKAQFTAPTGFGGVGTATNGLETSLDVVAGLAGNGDFKITNDKDIEIGAVEAVNVALVNTDGTLGSTNTPELKGIIVTNGLLASHILVDTVTGRIDVTEAVLNAGRGNILLQANGPGGSIDVGNLIYDEKGNISLIAATEVTQNSNIVSAADGSIDVEARIGNITMADTALSFAEEGPVQYVAEWDVILSALISMSDPVTVHAVNGSILDGGDSLQDVLAKGVKFVAGDSVGTEADPLETFIGFLASRAGAGGIHVVNDEIVLVDTVDDITIDRVNLDGTTTARVDPALSDLATTDNGDISLATVNGNIILQDGLEPEQGRAVHANGTGSINLDANGPGANIITASGVVSDEGHVCLLADGSIITAPGTTLIGNEGGDGSVAVYADANEDGTGDVLQLFGTIGTINGNIYIHGQNVRQLLQGYIATVNGDISITAHKQVQLAGQGVKTDTGAIVLTGGSLDIGSDIQGAEVGLRATTGSITGDGKVIGEKVSLRARKDIGEKADSFDVNADLLAAKTDKGNIWLTEEDSVEVGLILGIKVDATGVPPCAALIPVASVGPVSGVDADQFLDLNVGDDLSGTVVQAGADADVNVQGSVLGLDTLQAGGNIDLWVGGRYTGGQILAGGNIDGRVGSRLHAGLIQGNRIRFNAGSVDMARVIGRDDVEFYVGSDIFDNNSLITAPEVTLTAAGDIGPNGPIELDVGGIRTIQAGGNIDLVQRRGGNTPTGLIDAGNHLQVSVPNGRLVDRNGDALNINAQSATVNAQGLGTKSDALEIHVTPGNLQVNGAGLTPEDTPVDNVFVNLSGTINPVNGEKIHFFGAGGVPGLIILNGQVLGGDPVLLRRLRRAEAYLNQLDRMAFPKGLLATPFFVTLNYPAFEDWTVWQDYILEGQATITAGKDLPVKKQVVEIGPSASLWP